jgi:hypothetical protein
MEPKYAAGAIVNIADEGQEDKYYLITELVYHPPRSKWLPTVTYILQSLKDEAKMELDHRIVDMANEV